MILAEIVVQTNCVSIVGALVSDGASQTGQSGASLEILVLEGGFQWGVFLSERGSDQERISFRDRYSRSDVGLLISQALDGSTEGIDGKEPGVRLLALSRKLHS